MFFKCFLFISYYVLISNKYEVICQLYHQSDYKVKLEIFEIVDYNRSYGSNITARLSWYNRTARVINGEGILIKELNTKLTINIQIYKFASNEYRFFPITLTTNACEEISQNRFGMADFVKKFSNIPTVCPFKKGSYRMTNGVIDFTQFPPYIPTGRYKYEGKLYNDGDYIALVNVFASVKENKMWWLNG